MPTLEVLCNVLLVPTTAALVSALRKLPVTIDGKLAVFVCASLVGLALSFAYHFVAPLMGANDDAALLLVASRGVAAAALAFGAASWPRWCAEVLHTALANAAAVKAETSGSKASLVVTVDATQATAALDELRAKADAVVGAANAS